MDPTQRPTIGNGTSQHEEFEAVPWDALIRRQPQPWSGRLPLLAAVGLGVLAVTVAVVRAYWPAAPMPADPLAVPVASTAPVAAFPSVAAPPQAEALSEADLMAVDPAALDAAARAHAEWYLSRFFTRDASTPLDDPHLNIALASGDQRSYVESTHAIEVEAVSASQRRVTVVVRTLSASDPDDGFVRQPERAVEVLVRVGDLGLEVEDLPKPVVTPPLVAQLPPLNEVIRPDLVEVARTHLGQYGVPAEEPYHVGATADGRVRVAWLVQDGAGLPWPIAVWFSPAGVISP